MSMQLIRISQILAAAMIVLAAATTYAADDFPGAKPDRRLIKMQEKVDLLFEKGTVISESDTPWNWCRLATNMRSTWLAI